MGEVNGTLPLFSEDGGAEFSPNRSYRYRLWRRWGNAAPAYFCMLNPSTANETDLDPTLRRCVGFAKSWGCGGIVVVNLFAVVSPDPKVLLAHPDPVGPRNDEVLFAAADSAKTFVVGWGAFPEAKERARAIMPVLMCGDRAAMCLGTNADGSPKHPLYLPKTSDLIPWRAEP